MNEIPEWTIGDRLAKSRRRAGLTQDEMAAVCLVSRQTVNTWENDGHRPARRKILAWALRTGVDPVWIEYGDGGSGIPGHRTTGWLSGKGAIPKPRRPHGRLTGSAANHPMLAHAPPFPRAA